MSTQNNQQMARAFLRYKWGNEINANYAGSTAQMRGDDLLSTIRNGAITEPDPFPSGRIVFAGQSPDPNVSFPPGIPDAAIPVVTDMASGIPGITDVGKFFSNPNLLKDFGLLLLAIIIIAIGLWALVK